MFKERLKNKFTRTSNDKKKLCFDNKATHRKQTSSALKNDFDATECYDGDGNMVLCSYYQVSHNFG